MSVRQLATIPKFIVPARVTSKEAAEVLKDDRMVFIMQYPDKLYEYREYYKPFESIVCVKGEEYSVNIPQSIQEKHAHDYYHNYNVPTIEPLNKANAPEIKEPEVVYESWGPPEPQQNFMPVLQQVQQQSGLPPRVNQLRIRIGFGNFSPIMS